MSIKKQQDKLNRDVQELNRLNQSLQREKQKERKERTHRLIQKGALAEKYFNLYELNPNQSELFFKFIRNSYSDDDIKIITDKIKNNQN